MADFSRTELLFGGDAMQRLSFAKVAVFGLGGVGSYIVEALVRSGVGTLFLADGDTVAPSNVNRQIIATQKTIGMAKTQTAKDRATEINPDIKIETFNEYFTKENAEKIDFSKFDYVADAIDMVSSKLLLVKLCEEAGTPIISSMGTGGKISPAMLEIADIYSTDTCPLARVMRRELKKMGIKKLKTVFSREKPSSPGGYVSADGRHTPGSCAFVPATAGLMIASEIIKDIAEVDKK